ncbi:hypothetical protein N7492_007741 [Penicillium capsulatum]|uniref:CENP-T/Histone H4 histone fold domain-containing protein n=1 Tax=Penicillium capsulatum TaxID=69766 RepID=A0A9W9LLZ2_9EURO|nr:hypothetical protein N7492_007741 [Penicillium capsulatum]KAJ6117573.1 hypothetical protein N7512_007298 [Penicillium capsulatum]
MSTPNSRDRRSLGNSGVGTSTPSGETTLTGLQRLPGHTRFPLTPSRFVSAATPSAQRSASRFTPRGRPAAAPATPHALRARQQRAANTPGRDRRRSGRMQRETVFDVLKNLGKTLAPVSQPIQSSPQEQSIQVEDPIDEIEELDNEPEVAPPRLSLPIQEVEDESEEASPEMRPPRLSIPFEDDDITYRSVEYPRRDLADRDRDRLSMMSRGALGRISEDFGDTRLESDFDVGEETGIVDDDEDAQEETMISGGDFDRGGETEDLGRFHFDLNFPSPTAAPVEDPSDGPLGEMEAFELAAPDILPVPRSVSPDDDAGGDFGLGLDLAPAVSPSESPGDIGGGLRDEGPAIQGKQKKLSRHGIPVPNLPAGVVKKLATRFAPTRGGSKAKINKSTMAAIEQASLWFFEQASQDLGAYSKHAGRKTIDESDVMTLMRRSVHGAQSRRNIADFDRQRHINNSTTVFSLAQKHLPKELQQDMRLAMPP